MYEILKVFLEKQCKFIKKNFVIFRFLVLKPRIINLAASLRLNRILYILSIVVIYLLLSSKAMIIINFVFGLTNKNYEGLDNHNRINGKTHQMMN